MYLFYIHVHVLNKCTSLQEARLYDGQGGNEFQRRIYRMYSICISYVHICMYIVLRYFKSYV